MAAGSGTQARIPYSPGIDGLRGLAVLAVLVFHAGPASWLPGGFLGVSLFFTLSGYLIATLVLVEVESSGHLSLSQFWARRVRRLVPALLVTTALVIVLAHTIELPRSTRGELLGGLGYVANWVQLASGKSYAELFQTPSALTHLWSLAIEEQFYVVFPLAAWLVARRWPRHLRTAFLAGAALVTVAGAATAWFVDDQAFTYYSTITRAPEIGVGILLAVATRQPAVGPSCLATLVGVGGLGVTLMAWRWSGVTDAWIARGGLVVFALVSTALVAAAIRPGPVSAVLGWWPLRSMGRISYGLYLFHWPVVVLLSHPRVRLDPVLLFVARSTVAMGLTLASYFLVEQPIRHGRIPALIPSGPAIRAGVGALVMGAVIVLFAVPVPPTLEQLAAGHPAPALVDAGSAPPAGTPAGDGTSSTQPGPPVALILGDSVPNWLVRDGASGLDADRVALIDGSSEGCDGAEGAPVGRAGTGVVVSVPETCTGWRAQYPPLVGGRPVDVAILAVGSGAVLDRELDGEFRGPCSAEGREWYRGDVRARLDYLAGRVGRLVVVLPAWAEDWSGWVNPPDHRARTDCVRDTLRAAASQARVPTGGTPVRVVDLAAELCPAGRNHCAPFRQKDGVHIDADRAPAVLGWVIDQAMAGL
ncbi:MAG: acyltransferase [Aquihabitans sp.]